MNQADRDRLVALKKAKKKLITQKQAAEEISVTERQARRLLRKLRRKGDRAVIDELRGRASNRKLPAEMDVTPTAMILPSGCVSNREMTDTPPRFKIVDSRPPKANVARKKVMPSAIECSRRKVRLPRFWSIIAFKSTSCVAAYAIMECGVTRIPFLIGRDDPCPRHQFREILVSG